MVSFDFFDHFFDKQIDYFSDSFVYFREIKFPNLICLLLKSKRPA